MRKLLSIVSHKQRFFMLCTILVFFAFCIRVIRVSAPPTFYFDEVYHGFTATTFLHNDPKGYEYWQTPPAGVAYEWTHPPLAKLFMALGMVVFGEQSFGWRISSVVFGTLVVALTGLIAHTLFQRKFITLLSLGFASIDGLLITMSRIAMNDMHVVAFSLCATYFYIRFVRVMTKRKAATYVILTTIFLGLALASKWAAIYLAIGFCIDQIGWAVVRRRLPPARIIWIGILMPLVIGSVYLLAYTQFFLQGHTLTQWWETQQQMWWYHTGLKATHGYQSRPLQWITDSRPVWMYVDYSKNQDGILAHIYNVGNPVLFLGGLLAVVGIMTKYTADILLQETKKSTPSWEVMFVGLLYLVFWVPWIFSPRIMFFYHYAPALPFLFILSAWALERLFRHRSTSWIVPIFLAAACSAFILLYPLNTGLPVAESYFTRLFTLFPMWK